MVKYGGFPGKGKTEILNALFKRYHKFKLLINNRYDINHGLCRVSTTEDANLIRRMVVSIFENSPQLHTPFRPNA